MRGLTVMERPLTFIQYMQNMTFKKLYLRHSFFLFQKHFHFYKELNNRNEPVTYVYFLINCFNFFPILNRI